jgi:hypothetical protein
MSHSLSFFQRARMKWIAHGAKPQVLHLPEDLSASRRFLFCLPPDPRAQMLARAFMPKLVPLLGDRQVTMLLPPSRSRTPIVAIGQFESYMPTPDEVSRGMFPNKKLEERLAGKMFEVAINLDVTGHPFPACGALSSGARLRIGCAATWGHPFANIILTPESGRGAAEQGYYHCLMSFLEPMAPEPSQETANAS